MGSDFEFGSQCTVTFRNCFVGVDSEGDEYSGPSNKIEMNLGSGYPSFSFEPE